MARTLILGAVLGTIGGMVFGIFYFGTGQITAPMAYVHDVSGAALGVLIAWIVYLHKKASVNK